MLLLAVDIEGVLVIRSLGVDRWDGAFFDETGYESLVDHSLLLIFFVFLIFHISVVSLFRHPRGVSTG